MKLLVLTRESWPVNSPLTVKQAALHASVSESLIYRWCEDGTLPHMEWHFRSVFRSWVRTLSRDTGGYLV